MGITKANLAASALMLSVLPLMVLADVSVEELNRRCEAAREKRIAPLRQQAIEECVAKGQKSREECTRFYADYGEGGRTGTGTYRPRMFSDLPECQTADKAEKEQAERASDPEKTKSRDTGEGKKRDTN